MKAFTASAGAIILAVATLGAAAAPFVAPHAVDARFPELLNAPPTRVRLRDDAGRWRRPFIYPWIRVSQLEQRYEADRASPVPLRWLRNGGLVSSSEPVRAPLLWLGADGYGQDVFTRVLYGARLSLGLAILASLGAMAIGTAVGALAGYVGGAVDDALMRASDFVLVLPAIYVALALRSVMPLVLTPAVVFVSLLGIFSVVGAPFFSRGVRAIVRSERTLDYAAAAASLGASHARVLVRHLLPAARGFVVVELTMLVPAFIVAEATLSYVGLGFPDPVASWGTMLHEGSSIRALVDFPWLLSPALAMFLVVLALNVVLQARDVYPSADRPL